jgi:hypothetical protein
MATETARFPKEVVEILTRPMDKAALSPAPRGLTSIKSIYVTERLNEAFGYGRWFVDDAVVATQYPMVVVKVVLTLLDYPWFRAAAYGGNNNPDMGDAYKGAVTDGISKVCAMYLGVASEVFKGHGMDPEPKPELQRKSNGNGHVADDEPPVFDEFGEPVIVRKPVNNGIAQTLKSVASAVPSIAVTGEAAISEGKAKRFWAIALGKGKTKDEIQSYLHSIGLEDIKNCPWRGKAYENAVTWAETV